MPAPDPLLTSEEMQRADAITAESGLATMALMREAAAHVADEARAMLSLRLADAAPRVLVLCGPGNNGGDGYAAACLLADAGIRVSVIAAGEPNDLTGDASTACAEWKALDQIATLDTLPEALAGTDLIIDALLGAGLSRDLDPAMRVAVQAVNDASVPVLAVDVPTGLDGTTGQPRPIAIKADRTITFFRRKHGHLLQPGRHLCGTLRCHPIAIAAHALDEIAPRCFANTPPLWRHTIEDADPADHKYHRGHTLVLSGPRYQTGAARLAAMAALRSGSGLVTMASPGSALATNAAHLTAIMLTPCDDAPQLADLLSDRRMNVCVLGPGMGYGLTQRAQIDAALCSGAATVLDADALTAAAEAPDALFDLIKGTPERPVVMTPHDGEFLRLFADIDHPSKVARAREAARRSGATVVLKGSDTVIASPDGKAAINAHAPPWLATAGSGDVLAGTIAGLLAQRTPSFEAACAAVWAHGDAAIQCGRYLIAEDLPHAISRSLAALFDAPFTTI